MKALLNSRVYGPDGEMVANVGDEVEIVGNEGGYRPLPQTTALGVGNFSQQRYKALIIRLRDGSQATCDEEDVDVSPF